ncbi:hypothetical protein FOA52_012513 [Chlamydomonas sp. UWO 241]|nr:hypothetical protein FOA52_012513 [Chlamydomonas sp. UWO 241]
MNAVVEGRAPYKAWPCGSAGQQGFQVAVAVMQSFESLTFESKAAAAERIASALHDSWGVGMAECNNGVLVLLSVDDRQLYISTGKGATSRLSDAVLGRIIDDARARLKVKNYDAAVENTVVALGQALAAPEPSGGSWFLPLAMISAFLGFVIWGARGDMRRQSTFSDAKSKLERLKRDQSSLRSGATYNPSSCPICLEDFDAPPLPPQGADDGIGASGAGGSGADGSGGSGGDGADSDSTPLLGLRARVRAAWAEKGGKQEGAAGGSLSAQGVSMETEKGPSAPPAAPWAPGHAPVPRARLVLPCRHTFCEECITQWVEAQKKTSCPVCRKPIDEGPDDARRPGSRPPCSDGTTETDDVEADAESDGVFTNAYGERYRGYRDARYRTRGYTAADAARDDMLYRMGRMRRRYPMHITDAMLLGWNRDIAGGRDLDASLWRSFALSDPAVRMQAAQAGSRGASHSFGGGSSRGGGGRGGSW